MSDENMNTQELVVDAPVAEAVAEINVQTEPAQAQSETTTEAAPASAPASPFDAVKPRAAFKGKVTRAELGGAYFDIGVGVEGFMHISQMGADQPITRVADFIKVGDEVDVYVARVNASKKRFELTMIKPPTFDWNNLAVGAQLHGVKVVAVESFGAFVDIDGPKHGLVPFNLMPKGDRPAVGDAIETVWVIEVSEDKRRIGLTMIEPAARSWETIHRGDKFVGKVTRIERMGAYVDIGAEREGLIRTSSVGPGFINMNTIVNIGEEVTVTVAKIDASRKQIDFSLEGIDKNDFSLSSGPDEIVSPFAAAMQRAQKVKKAQDKVAAAKNN